MDIKDFKAGQAVYIELTGNACRGKSGTELIEEWEIVSVGRKLIKAKRKGWSNNFAISFEKREYGYGGKFVEKTDRCVDYVLYADKKEIEDKFEKTDLLRSISEYFGRYGEKNISLDSLRKIAELIKESEC